jgi:predicted methyltransferase
MSSTCMRALRRLLSAGCLAAVALSPASADEADAAIAAAVAGEHRSAEHRARDAHRHPAETLRFFGLQPGMKVIEMLPGADGWYTEILAPVLRDKGLLITEVLPPRAPPAYAKAQFEGFNKKLDAAPALYDRVERRTLDGSPLVLGPPGSVDMVLTFRSTHGWIRTAQFDEVYSAIFDVLRSGGILGIEQHRAPDDADVTESAKKGYVPQRHLIEQLELIGFELEESAEINANPRDTKDYPDGVWTLPPTLVLGEKDRARYTAIGESDRMTLRFRKP